MAGRLIATTEDGFLLDREQWDEEVALALSAIISVVIEEDHWPILHFIRDYHARFDHLPNNRLFIRSVATTLGPALGNSHRLNRLFSGSPVRNACLLAGLPKPPGCL